MRFNTIKELYNSYAKEYSNYIPFEELSEDNLKWWKNLWYKQCEQYKNKTHDYAD